MWLTKDKDIKTNSTYHQIIKSIAEGQKGLAVLIDPDKMMLENVPDFVQKLNASIATYIFVGGSSVDDFATEALVIEIKKHTQLPIVLFPGDVTQITDYAHAILFLSLISGTNPEYLIGKHIDAVSKLKHSNLDVIPTGYILIANGKQTAVEKVTRTKPLSREDIPRIVDTAKAGELLGMQLVYLEAGSGALHPVSVDIISAVKKEVSIPIIVGGGIRNTQQMESAYQAGADLVVIGTAFEDDDRFFDKLRKKT